MSEKATIRRSVKSLRQVKTWQLIVLLILVGVVAATFLRLNNIGMIERRAAVLSADKEGDQEVVIKRLYDLQRYVSSHMNTDLGRGVYLESSYARDLQTWQETQYGDRNPNGNIYKKAQEACAPRFSSYSAAYLQCTTSELAKYPSADELASDTSKPSQETYIHAFAAPLWTPDFAGWTVLVFGVIAALIVIRLIGLAILSIMLKRQYKRI